MSAAYEIAPGPRIVAGAGCLDGLSERLATLGGAQVLLVTDPAVAALGWPQRLSEALGGRFTVEVHVVPPGEPNPATVDAGAERVRALPKPMVIGLGGGSTLDCAKLIAGLAVNPGTLIDYLLCARPFTGRCPAVMIPTTSGTGAEVTRTCVVSDARGAKSWAWDEVLRPDLVLLDPRLTRSVPKALTVATGLDAFVHALEALTAQRRNAFAAAQSLRAIRLIIGHLPRAVAEPDDPAARLAMQEAACLAGLAIDACGTGIAHCIGHALGTLHHLPHGVSVALGLQATLTWSLAGTPEVYREAARCFRPEAAPEDLPVLFDAWLNGLDFPACLPPAAAEPDVAALADCMRWPENQPMALNNARLPSDRDYAELAALSLASWWRYRPPQAAIRAG